jgi:hypothetical protein
MSRSLVIDQPVTHLAHYGMGSKRSVDLHPEFPFQPLVPGGRHLQSPDYAVARV